MIFKVTSMVSEGIGLIDHCSTKGKFWGYPRGYYPQLAGSYRGRQDRVRNGIPLLAWHSLLVGLQRGVFQPQLRVGVGLPRQALKEVTPVGR